jgi:hypothetical protein
LSPGKYILYLGILLLFTHMIPNTQAQHNQSGPGASSRYQQYSIPFRPRHTTDPVASNNQYWGDYLGPKDPSHLRMYLQNPNRISARENFTDFEYLCQNLLTHDVDIFSLSETGIDWKKHQQRNRYRQILDNFWSHSRLITSHSTENPIYGTGQGSAGSPCVWLLMSTMLFHIMEKIAHGTSFTDLTQKETIQ